MSVVRESGGSNLFFPIRGAIAGGARAVVDTSASVPVKHPVPIVPWVGRAPVQAAELEKSAQKGMRLLIEQSVIQNNIDLERSLTMRTFAVRGFEHYELNWLAPISADDHFLTDNRDFYKFLTSRLMELETNYTQQLSASLSHLIYWSDEKAKSQSDFKKL